MATPAHRPNRFRYDPVPLMLAPDAMPALMVRRMFQIIMKAEVEAQKKRHGDKPGPQVPLPGKQGQIRFLEWVRAFNIVIEQLFDEKALFKPTPGKPLMLTTQGRLGYTSEKTGALIRGEKDYIRGPERLKTGRVRDQFNDWAESLTKVIGGGT
jgi:hypothetical protein